MLLEWGYRKKNYYSCIIIPIQTDIGPFKIAFRYASVYEKSFYDFDMLLLPFVINFNMVLWPHRKKWKLCSTSHTRTERPTSGSGRGQKSYIYNQQCDNNEVVLGRAHQPPQR